MTMTRRCDRNLVPAKDKAVAAIPWRLIPACSAPGLVHMAVDHWLLEQHRRGQSLPVLRFYTWSEATISLGYHQRHWPAHWQALSLPLVRRPTGGRAVLHQGDLTYSLISPNLPGSRQQVYRHLCQFLRQGFANLGITLDYGKTQPKAHRTANCFALATTADLVTPTGAKLIGSAQLRRDHSILQHGSIVLRPDRCLWTRVFGGPPTLAPLPTRLATLPWEQLQTLIIQALCQAAETCFTSQWQVQPLTGQEIETALKAMPALSSP